MEGRETSFRRVFEGYYRPVLAFFRSRGLSRAEAEDLAQETFLHVFRGMGALREAAALRSWIFKTARNLYLNELRNRSTQKRDAQEVSLDGAAEPASAGAESRLREEREGAGSHPAPPPQAVDPGQGPLEDVFTQERLSLLRAALDELPEQMRRCILLRVAADLRYEEIAAVMQISVKTVGAQLFQARSRLKTKLGGYFSGIELD